MILLTKQIDWHKVLLYSVLAAMVFFYGKSCNENKEIRAASERNMKKADSLSIVANLAIFEAEKLDIRLKEEKVKYSKIESKIDLVSKDLAKIKIETSKRVAEVRSFTDKEKQTYFDSIYGKSIAPVVHLDSVVSTEVIVDLEVGKSAVKENLKFIEKVTLLNEGTKNLQGQVLNLEDQNKKTLEAYTKEQESNSINKKEAVDNLNLYTKEKRRKNTWKVLIIPAFLFGLAI